MLVLPPLLATDSSSCEDLVPKWVCVCVCACARLLVRFLLPCQNISCCLFIYFSLITKGIVFPEECQQMIRTQDWYCQQTHASPFCRKNFIFSRRKPWVWSRIQIRFLGIFLLSLSSPPGGAMEGAHSAATQCLNPIYSFSWRDNYSPETS